MADGDVQDTPAVLNEHPKGKHHHGWLHYTPGFAFLLVVYIIIEFLVGDVRAVLVEVGAFKFSMVEVFYLAALVVALVEMLKVSHPGIDNNLEVVLMLLTALLYVVLFIFGANDLRFLGLFKVPVFGTTEFLMLTLASIATMVVAYFINTRTFGRSIVDTR